MLVLERKSMMLCSSYFLTFPLSYIFWLCTENVLSFVLDDWKYLFGNPTKFGLGLFSVMFDVLFMVQHYGLYRKPHGYSFINEETIVADSEWVLIIDGCVELFLRFGTLKGILSCCECHIRWDLYVSTWCGDYLHFIILSKCRWLGDVYNLINTIPFWRW